MLPGNKKGCKHARKICSTCGNCYYCHHEAVYNEVEDAWYWRCPDGKLKLAGMDLKLNS